MTNKIDYKVEAEIRFKKLVGKLKKKSLADRRKILLDATDYQSGEGLLNTVYMGGLATARLTGVLGGRYGKEPFLVDLIKTAKSDVINLGLRAAIHTIEYMLANPRSKCPMCGQIIAGDD